MFAIFLNLLWCVYGLCKYQNIFLLMLVSMCKVYNYILINGLFFCFILLIYVIFRKFYL